MASRHMRRSRRSSPMDTSMKDSVPIKRETHADENNADDSEEWTEPPLRPPAPSFEDYKGLERHGVLEHMAPLGSLPGTKVKARLKQHEPSRRATHLKNGDARAARDEVSTPEPVLPAITRRSEPRKPEERPAKVSSSRERDEDYEYKPKGNVRAAPAKAAPTHAAAQGTPLPRTAREQMKLRQIVDTAIKRSNDLGDDVLGIAVKQLYEESLHNRALADLLDAVLTQKPTPQQTLEFQSYIKGARKKIKAGDETGSKSVSKSPAAKSARTSFTRHFGNLKDQSSASGINHHPPNSNHRSSKQTTNSMETNGSPSKDERPVKRIKRSKSASSDSSLSSLDSAVEDFAPSIESALPSTSNSLPTKKLAQPKFQPSMGPRLGSFSTRPSDASARRPIISPANSTVSPTPEDLLARKRERERLKQSFRDHVVLESGIRVSPAPRMQARSTGHLTVLAERGQSGRIRNGTNNRNRRDDYEALDSPGSSSYGDLLIPPPPGASRGATPNQLGRPPKAIKKTAARIKMSPVKRRTTAGLPRAAETESNAVSYGRLDDNPDNSDVCSACSGSGKLLCCDGCWRAFHFTCCDPPKTSEQVESIEVKWYCYKCEASRSFAPPLVERGVFGELISELNKKNPTAFHLPPAIRDYFDGVKTGDEGEYEDSGVAKANKVRGGYEQLPDNFKLKDNKENSVLCFRCCESALDKREVIPCDYCNLSWHLDCLDPPLAVSPVKRNNKKSSWMCPNHIDHELAHLGSQAQMLVQRSIKLHAAPGRAFKIRRPKNALIVDIGLRRGFKNNGLIEIENDPSDEDSDYDEKHNAKIYRVTESGLKLDFIDRIKRTHEEEAQAEALQALTRSRAATTEAQQPSFEERPFVERQAAILMLQLAQTEKTPISEDAAKNLMYTLTAEAPDRVGKLYAAEDAEEELHDLETLIELAQRRIDQLKGNTTADA